MAAGANHPHKCSPSIGAGKNASHIFRQMLATSGTKCVGHAKLSGSDSRQLSKSLSVTSASYLDCLCLCYPYDINTGIRCNVGHYTHCRRARGVREFSHYICTGTTDEKSNTLFFSKCEMEFTRLIGNRFRSRIPNTSTA